MSSDRFVHPLTHCDFQNLQEIVSQMQTAASVLDTGVKDFHLHLIKEFDNVDKLLASLGFVINIFSGT